MANFDKFIEMMAQRQVERAVLIGGQPFQLFINGLKTEGSVISIEQLRQSLIEVTPEHLRPQIEAGSSLHFSYNSPHGPYEVSVDTLFDAFQVTLTLSNSQRSASPNNFAPALGTQLAPPRPTAVVNQQQSFCQRCGTPNALGASFCSGCGNGMGNIPTTVVTGGMTTSAQPANVVNVTVQQNNSSGGWLAAWAVMLFATPLGCIAIPVAVVVLLLVVGAGIAFAPMIIAIIASVIVWKHPSISQHRKMPILAGILAVGLVVQIAMFAASNGATPTETPQTTSPATSPATSTT